MKSFKNHIVVYIFFLIIGFFYINQKLTIIQDLDYSENKEKDKRPVMDINRLDYYPNQFESYFRDNFSLRGYFIKYMGWIYRHIWEKSPKPDGVIIGQNNWLYNVDKELDCYNGKRNFNDEQLNEILQEFLYRKRVLDSMGIKMLVVLHPTKYAVYPENLPPFMNSVPKINSATQLMNCFRDSSDIKVFYSRDILVSKKKEHELFYKGDNHWNDLAGYYVAKEIVNQVDLGIPEIPLTKFCTDTIFNSAGNLALMMGNAEEYAETRIKYRMCENDAIPFERFKHIAPENVAYAGEFQKSFKSVNENLPNAVIIRDSFGDALMPYLQNSFHYSTFIWDGWNYSFNLEVIQKEKPDVVIYMILESIIPNIYTNGLSKDWK